MTAMPSSFRTTSPGEARLTRLIFPDGAISWPLTILIFPPIRKRVFPLLTDRLLPSMVIPSGLLLKNPKAEGAAMVSLLVLDGSV